MIKTGTCTLEVKGIDLKNRIVEGYFASFGTLDSDNDIFVKGAFAKSIAENGPNSSSKRIKHLFNHWDTVGVLQELKEDEQGLYYKSFIGNHSLGNDVLNMYQDGIITEHSVGFQRMQFEVSKDTNSNDIVYIKEAKVWEGSSLDKWGANKHTPVLKSIDEFNEWAKHWEKRFDALTKALRNRTNYTDETYNNFEFQVMQLKDAFNYALKQVKPLASTLQKDEPQVIIPEAKDIDYNSLINILKR